MTTLMPTARPSDKIQKVMGDLELLTFRNQINRCCMLIGWWMNSCWVKYPVCWKKNLVGVISVIEDAGETDDTEDLSDNELVATEPLVSVMIGKAYPQVRWRSGRIERFGIICQREKCLIQRQID